MAIDSRWHREDLTEFRNILPVFEPISENPKGECFDLGYRFLATVAVNHNARQLRHFGYPSLIVFAFNFDIHDSESQFLATHSAGRYRPPSTSLVSSQYLPSRGEAIVTISHLTHHNHCASCRPCCPGNQGKIPTHRLSHLPPVLPICKFVLVLVLSGAVLGSGWRDMGTTKLTESTKGDWLRMARGGFAQRRKDAKEDGARVGGPRKTRIARKRRGGLSEQGGLLERAGCWGGRVVGR